MEGKQTAEAIIIMVVFQLLSLKRPSKLSKQQRFQGSYLGEGQLCERRLETDSFISIRAAL